MLKERDIEIEMGDEYILDLQSKLCYPSSCAKNLLLLSYPVVARELPEWGTIKSVVVCNGLKSCPLIDDLFQRVDN